MLQTLYSSASWPTLANFVDRALAGNATAVVNLADSYLGIKSDGTYDNSGDMNLAVNCLDRDFSRDPKRTQQLATTLSTQAPHFGPPVAPGGANCAYWGTPAKALKIASGKGSPPLLLIGATGDPFAPYREAVAVSKRMTSSVLLTYDGESHPAFMHGVSLHRQRRRALLPHGRAARTRYHLRRRRHQARAARPLTRRQPRRSRGVRPLRCHSASLSRNLSHSSSTPVTAGRPPRSAGRA